jgi:hypothetical protein
VERALELLASDRPAERLDIFAARVARARTSLGRMARDYFQAGGAGPLRLVTISFSRTVVTVLEAIAATRQLRVSCSESRPALEDADWRRGSRRQGWPSPSSAMRPSPTHWGARTAWCSAPMPSRPSGFLNKTGTRMLAAAAAQQGVPVQVLATRDKFVSHAVGSRLVLREGGAVGNLGVATARRFGSNPYFESTHSSSSPRLLLTWACSIRAQR